MILDRYLVREIATPFLAATAALVFVFASYSASRYLADAAQGQLPAHTVLELVSLKVLIALELLVPMGLYLGLIFGLGRLYNDQEITVLQTAGLARTRMLRPLLGLALVVAVLVAALSLLGRPWAYGQLYALEAEGESELDLARVEPGSFHRLGDDGPVLYAQRVHAGDNTSLEDVLMSQEESGYRTLIRARRADRLPMPAAPEIALRFHQGRLYRLDMHGGHDQSLQFDEFIWRYAAPEEVIGYKAKAASSAALWSAPASTDAAELQWRATRPLATVALALLAVALARSAPRQGRFASSFVAVAAFAVYYNLSGVARTWLEHGSVGRVPGLWWVDAVVFVLALALLFRPGQQYY